MKQMLLDLEYGMCLTIAAFIIVRSRRSHSALNEPTSQNNADPYLNPNCVS